MTADNPDAWDARPSDREIVQTAPGKFEARDAADNWEPSEAVLEIAASILGASDNPITFFINAIKAVRPLLIAEAQAEERERVLEEAANVLVSWASKADTIRLAMGEMTAQEMRSVKAALLNRAAAIRALKNSKP